MTPTIELIAQLNSMHYLMIYQKEKKLPDTDHHIESLNDDEPCLQQYFMYRPTDIQKQGIEFILQHTSAHNTTVIYD